MIELPREKTCSPSNSETETHIEIDSEQTLVLASDLPAVPVQPERPNGVEGSMALLVDELIGGGLIFLDRFGVDDRNRAISLNNYAANVMVAIGEDAIDPWIVHRVGKLIVGEYHVYKVCLDDGHPKFADDIKRFVELAKTVDRRRAVSIEHN